MELPCIIFLEIPLSDFDFLRAYGRTDGNTNSESKRRDYSFLFTKDQEALPKINWF